MHRGNGTHHIHGHLDFDRTNPAGAQLPESTVHDRGRFRRMVDALDLPAGTTIGAVVRGEKVMVLEKDVVIEPDDHIVLFVADKKCIPEVEKLFQVDVGFI
jgi:Trk K+ transport system NAD-binding subunit